MAEQEPLDGKTLALHIGVLYDALQQHRRRTRIAVVGIIASMLFMTVLAVVLTRGLSTRVASVEAWSVQTDKHLKETANELVATKTVAARQTRELTDEIASVRRERRDDPLPAIADRMKDTVALIVCENAVGDYVTGSGTIFTATGLVLTNQHVLPETAETTLPCVIVYQPWKGEDGSAVFGLEYVSGDPERDLAIVKMVDEEGGDLPSNQVQNFLAIEGVLCRDSDVSVARSLLILGYPNYSEGELDPTLSSLKVTSGKISSLLPDGDVVTDAKLEHGNSGGAAFLDTGCFIGVPTAVLAGSVETLGVIRRVRAPQD